MIYKKDDASNVKITVLFPRLTVKLKLLPIMY